MYDDISRTAKRMNRIKAKATNRFDASLLHYRVYEALGQASRVRQFVDVAERTYQLEENDEDYTDDVRQAAFGAAEELNDKIEDVVEVQIAVECATLVKDVRTDWFDAPERPVNNEAVEAAFNEACAWLADHPGAAEAAGINVDEVVRNNSDETEKSEFSAE